MTGSAGMKFVDEEVAGFQAAVAIVTVVAAAAEVGPVIVLAIGVEGGR